MSILHFEEKVGTLYLGDVEFLPRMTPISCRSGFDGCAGFLWPCARRVSIVHEVDSQYVLKCFLWNPDCSGWKNSEWSFGLVHFLSGILLTGGGQGCGAFGVIRFGSSNFGYPGVAGSRHCDNLFYRAVARGSRFKGTQFTSSGLSYTRDDPAYTLPERLLDPVGVGNGVDRDYGLGHGHPTHLSVAVAHAGEDGR